MSWINTIAYKSSSGQLRKLYDRVKGPDNNVDNIMMLHSLRPHTMEGHMAIYKYVSHHSSNTLPNWFLETLGVWVSALNGCDYCVDHHFEGLKRLLNNEARAQALKAAITKGDIKATELDTKQKLALHYARRLTQHPPQVTEGEVLKLREAGFSDGEILEINQVVAYFGYANRTVLGLGCRTKGNIIGLSPNNSDDPTDWSHS